MEANTKVYISRTAYHEYQTNETVVYSSIVFIHNLAGYGGAIEDGTDLGLCDSNPHLIQTSSLIQERTHYTECFLRIPISNQESGLENATASLILYTIMHILLDLPCLEDCWTDALLVTLLTQPLTFQPEKYTMVFHT